MVVTNGVTAIDCEMALSKAGGVGYASLVLRGKAQLCQQKLIINIFVMLMQ